MTKQIVLGQFNGNLPRYCGSTIFYTISSTAYKHLHKSNCKKLGVYIPATSQHVPG